MFKTIRDRWVHELRSGKHKQIRGVYDDGKGGRCAIGVLHYLYEQDTGLKLDTFKGEDSSHTTLSSTLRLMIWAGVNPFDFDSFTLDGMPIGIANSFFSFKTLADKIEKYIAITDDTDPIAKEFKEYIENENIPASPEESKQKKELLPA